MGAAAPHPKLLPNAVYLLPDETMADGMGMLFSRWSRRTGKNDHQHGLCGIPGYTGTTFAANGCPEFLYLPLTHTSPHMSRSTRQWFSAHNIGFWIGLHSLLTSIPLRICGISSVGVFKVKHGESRMNFEKGISHIWNTMSIVITDQLNAYKSKFEVLVR